MNKLYYPINWENYPSEATPINESNLNKIDSGLNNLDNRVIEQDALKLSKTDASNDIVNWTMDEETGVITITRRSGEQILFDLNIEKIPVSFSLSDDGILTMVTDDGTIFTANIGAMIPVLTFNDSDEIAVTATGTGINKTYSFSVKDNSITENKLQPNFLADIKVQSANASASASSATSSANDSSTYATQSKSYAVGETGTRENEDTDNSKYYSEQAKQALSEMQKSQVTGVKGNEETEYRTGEVNITAENVGAVKTGGDVAENTVTYESNDCGPDGDPALWEIPKLTTGEKLSSIMQKVSRIANNFRYFLKLLGTNDISSLGDGTVTGSLIALNDNLDEQIRTHSGSYTSILSIVKDIPSDKNRIYNITSDFTDYPPIMANMGYIVYPVIEVVSKGSVRYITLTACDANGYIKKIIGYTTLDLSSILWKFDTNIIDVLHLQATNSTSIPSVFTVNLPEKYQNISTVTLYAIAQPGYGWGSLAVTNVGISNNVIYIATNYSGSVISPFFNIILSY